MRPPAGRARPHAGPARPHAGAARPDGGGPDAVFAPADPVRPDGGGPDAVFAALGDATRREVLRAVSRGEATTATELAARLPISRQAVSKHLDVLARAHLVYGRREGRETRFAATPAPLAHAMTWMAGVGAEWDARLARLKDGTRSAQPPGGAHR